MRFWFLLTLLLAPVVIGGAAPPITTVILVRHAEKTGPEGDVPLSEAGLVRAKELARALSGAGVDVVYSTQWLRTKQTAEPLGIEPIIVQTGKTYATDLAKRITAENAGQTVVVVGHSNTTVDVMRALGVVDPPTIPDSQYDDLFIVTLAPDAVPKLVALRFGAVAR